MKKILYIGTILIAFLTQSCTKDFEKLNTNPAVFVTPDAEPVFASSVRLTIDLMASNNVDYLWEYTHVIFKGGRYNVGNDNNWQQIYVNILGNLKQLKNVYKDNPSFKNRMLIAEIWECYTYAYLVGLYGPVPYSQALDTSTPAIKYDTENSIYISLLDRLKKASEAIDPAGDKYTTDLVYGGDLLKWKKFANSLRLRLAIRSLRNLPNEAGAAVREIMNNETMLISSDADNAKFNYGTVDGNENPYFSKLLKTNPNPANQPRLSDFAFLYFRAYKDPRLSAYFEPVAPANQYTIVDTLSSRVDDTLRVVNYKIPFLGSPKSPVVLTTWNLPSNVVSPITGVQPDGFSALKPILLTPARFFIVMDYAETSFLKAEAKYMELGGTKTAEQYYIDGINANFTYWGIGSLAADYLKVDGIKWSTEGKGFKDYLGLSDSKIPADNLAKIRVQEWLNFFPDGAFDSWCLQRRTNNLKFPPHTNPANANLNLIFQDLPQRWEYPADNEKYNMGGFKDALALLGGPDFADVQLKFAAPFKAQNWNNVNAGYNWDFYQKWFGTTVQNLTAAGVTYTVKSSFVKP